ncbi:DUF1871 family protein [Bacillus suaedaesalsae]|uniref:DUF1871 family protein n=1 Tax=Bacillus suaedaesalsae TaxID=2810349 RepID=A0ABS2DJP9_9BACI|nr:DUF1871 family protein [Bacillus suaedaesalsae]MBM6618727.1 DUF1871 family protein [Bacillus suaedaesalsae]
MNTLNIKLYDFLLEWDPFGIGADNYDPEFADIIGAVNFLDHEEELAKKIQGIFEFSFERTLSMDLCLEKAKQLLQIKDEDDSCMIN